MQYKSKRKVYIQLWSSYDELLAELEVHEDESNLHAIANSGWIIAVGDTIKIIERLIEINYE